LSAQRLPLGRQTRAPWRDHRRGLRALPCSFVEERYESELARSASVLDGVDRALERLSDGTYGDCLTCGGPIVEADLERDPTRALCDQHVGPAHLG
jgi:hypothetical protein